ncbi:MAG TPA: RidA family protein [Actinomycetota bacterium]|nr:RidA family protein [Actinomycetota bacterium]
MGQHLRVIESPELGTAVAHYSQGIVAGDFIFLAGQVAFDENNKLVGEGDVVAQTKQVIKRMEIALREAGATLRDVVSATVFLRDLKDFPDFNRAWAEAFGDHKPARATVQAQMALPELLVEVQAVAYRGTR